MNPRETIILGADPVCDGCDTVLEPVVILTSGGYSVRTECECGPYSRETEYFKTRAEAEKALPAVQRLVGMRRTNYHIMKNDEVAAELNLKTKDLWSPQEMHEVIDAHPEAKIRL